MGNMVALQIWKKRDKMEEQTPEEKKIKLFLDQKKLLDTFLKTGAITKAQYEKSYTCMKEKMGLGDREDL